MFAEPTGPEVPLHSDDRPGQSSTAAAAGLPVPAMAAARRVVPATEATATAHWGAFQLIGMERKIQTALLQTEMPPELPERTTKEICTDSVIRPKANPSYPTERIGFPQNNSAA